MNAATAGTRKGYGREAQAALCEGMMWELYQVIIAALELSVVFPGIQQIRYQQPHVIQGLSELQLHPLILLLQLSMLFVSPLRLLCGCGPGGCKTSHCFQEGSSRSPEFRLLLVGEHLQASSIP